MDMRQQTTAIVPIEDYQELVKNDQLLKDILSNKAKFIRVSIDYHEAVDYYVKADQAEVINYVQSKVDELVEIKERVKNLRGFRGTKIRKRILGY